MAQTRRIFLRNGAFALVGTAAVPAFLTRSLEAQTLAARAQGKVLVAIFQRGAVDGLNMVVPYREKNYYRLRPVIGIPEKQVIVLDERFGLHPALSGLKPLWDAGHLAAVHACGSPDPTRSHFDAQDYMETGTPGERATATGWLNRALAAQDAAAHHLHHTALRAVAMGAQLPLTLAGSVPAVAIGNIGKFRVGGPGPARQAMSADFAAIYDDSSNALLHGTAQDAFAAVRALKSVDPVQYTPARGANYPKTAFGNSMRQIAQLVKANLGVEAAYADVLGWDTHQHQGGAEGQLAERLRDFGDSLHAFWMDLGDHAEKVVVVSMSEFGRTVHQNGTLGTDHGHANVMFALGGAVKGGKVYGRWPGLDDHQLYQNRDLAITTDFRQVLGEAAYHTLGAENLNRVFPGINLQSAQFLNILKA
jgi:uncharacterized protein (DUF1501 family)